MSKKTESIEIRVSPELKSRLAAHCDAQGRPMSATIRALLETELSAAAQHSPQSETQDMKFFAPLSPSFKTFSLASASVLGVAALIGFLPQSPAAAQATVRATFAELDYNGDGVISQAEFDRTTQDVVIDDQDDLPFELPAACQADFEAFEASDDMFPKFATIDKDGNGSLSFKELHTVISAEMNASFDQLDADKNGSLTQAEFFVIDAQDGDTGISEQCWTALEAQDDPADEADFQDDLRIEFAVLDMNRDQKVSRAEFLSQ